MTDNVKTLWANEGGHNITQLIQTLAEANGATAGHTLPRGGSRMVINDLTEDASELLDPVCNWMEASKAAGWSYEQARFTGAGWFRHADRDLMDYENWQDLCENEGIHPEPAPVLEHLLVSDWLADKLIHQGEKVVKGFAGLPVWAKTFDGPVHEHPAIVAIAEDYEPGADAMPAPGMR